MILLVDGNNVAYKAFFATKEVKTSLYAVVSQILKQRAIWQELPEYKLVERHPALLKQEAHVSSW